MDDAGLGVDYPFSLQRDYIKFAHVYDCLYNFSIAIGCSIRITHSHNKMVRVTKHD